MKGIIWGIVVVVLVDLCIGFVYGALLVIQFYEPNEDIEFIKFSMFVEITKHASQLKLSIVLATLPFLFGGYFGAKRSKTNGIRNAIVIAILFCVPKAYAMYSGLSEYTKYEDLLIIVLAVISSLIGAYLISRKSSAVESKQEI